MKLQKHTSFEGLSALGIVKTSEVRDQMLNILNNMPGITSRVVIGDINLVKKEIGNSEQYDVILLQIEKDDENVAKTLQPFQKIYGSQQPFIIISEHLEHERMLKLLRQGVNDFLQLPLDKAETVESIIRASERRDSAQGKSGGNSKIITFAHASGGMGATTLAVNAATIINAACSPGQSAACLLDLDLQFGGASIHLDLPGYSPVMDLLDRPERLDREMLEGMMMRHSSGLHVLTTPEAPLPVESINNKTVEKLLSLAQKRYRYIIVDMPTTMTLWTDSVFKKSKIIYVITQLNVPSIRQLRRWFSILEQEGLDGLPIKVLVNRYSALGRMRHDNISLSQASEALGRKIDYTIPNDYELISESLDQGMPASSIKPGSKFVRQMQTILNPVVEEIEIPKTGLLERLIT